MRLSLWNKNNLKEFFKDKMVIIFLLLNIMINALGWIYIYLKVRPQSELIPLHYNIYFGIDLIGKWYKVYLIPISALIILFINLIFSSIIYKKEKILIYLLLASTLFIQIIYLLAIYFILL